MRTIEEIKADIDKRKKCYMALDNNECQFSGMECEQCPNDLKFSEIELIDELMDHYEQALKGETE